MYVALLVISFAASAALLTTVYDTGRNAVRVFFTFLAIASTWVGAVAAHAIGGANLGTSLLSAFLGICTYIGMYIVFEADEFHKSPIILSPKETRTNGKQYPAATVLQDDDSRVSSPSDALPKRESQQALPAAR